MITFWRCIPCGSTSNVAELCFMCGRGKAEATDEARWERFFTVDAVIVEDEEECPHDHVLKDDDGRDYWFYVCDDCDKAVQLTEPDEDGQSFWEVIE